MSVEPKFAVLLHADVVGSTALVQRDEVLAHERIQGTFKALAAMIDANRGSVLEVRGDALVAEFERPSDALIAAVEFQSARRAPLANPANCIRPELRIGIAMGEVVVADDTVTGAGVVLAQRLEQLAESGGVCVSAAVREASPGRLEFQFRDLGEQRLKGFGFLQRAFTVSGRDDEGGDELVQSVTAAAAAGPGSSDPIMRPSIVVLPFESAGVDSSSTFLADGLVEDITTSLSCLRWLTVIARPSAVAVAARTTDLQMIGEALGVRFALHGSVRQAGDRIRVTAVLSETAIGRQKWTGRYDRTIEDVFELQDELGNHITAELGTELNRADMEAVRRKPPENLNAWEAYQRGWVEVDLRTNEAANNALALFEEAIAHDATFGAAYTGVCFVLWRLVHNYGIRGIEAVEAQGRMFTMAEKAITLDPRDGEARIALGMAYALRLETAAAMEEFNAGLVLSPNNAFGFARRGLINAMQGCAEEALTDLDVSKKLSPLDLSERGIRLGGSAYANIRLGRYEESLRSATELHRVGGHFGGMHAAVACVFLDDRRAARSWLAKARARTPWLSVALLRTLPGVRADESWGRYISALEGLGLPEQVPWRANS